MDAVDIAELEARVLDILARHPTGLKEFDLLRQLREEQPGSAGKAMFADSLDLYRAHFLLFHALYRLQDYLVAQKSALLDIHVLNIRLCDWRDADTSVPAKNDPIRAYYLDWSNLEEASLADVEALLGDFWVSYFAGEKRAEALAEMDLDVTASTQVIERRYRELAMQRHPDRGGDGDGFQRLQWAIEVLRRSTR